MRTTTKQTIKAATTTTNLTCLGEKQEKVINSPVLKIKKKRHKI